MNTNFHDANIEGIFYEEKNEKLTLHMKLSNNQKVELEFIQVKSWELSPFEVQNVIFNIREFDSTNFPEWLKNDYSIPQLSVDFVLSGENRIFYLEPSVGLDGYIIAKEMNVIS